MVGDTITPSGIVIHEAEIILVSREHLYQSSQLIETTRYRSRRGNTIPISIVGHFLPRFRIQYLPAGPKRGGCIDPEDSGVPGCVDLRLDIAAVDLVFHAVEEEVVAQKSEELGFDGGRDEGCEVEEVQVWEVGYGLGC